jgi:hypothetical protein
MKKSEAVSDEKSKELTKTNKKFDYYLSSFCNKYIILAVGILVLIIGITSIVFSAYFEGAFDNVTEKTLYRRDNPIVMIIYMSITLLLIAILNRLVKNVKARNIFILLILFSTIIQFAWIFKIKLIPRADQAYVIQDAQKLLKGNYEYFSDKSSYFSIYPFQLGFIYYLALAIKIYGKTNCLFLQCLNVVFSIMNMVTMYLIMKELVNKKAEKISAILIFAFSIYFVFFNPHVYGNIIGMTFALLALLFTLKYFKKNNIRYLVLTAITISISIVLKSNYNIFLCGIVICLFLNFLKSHKGRTILGIVGIILTYILFSKITTLSLSLLAKSEISKGIPMISYVYMGMENPTDKSCGWYTEGNLRIFIDSGYDIEETKAISIEKIKERVHEFINDPKLLVSYYKDKISSTWLNPTFQTIWCSYPGYQMSENTEYRNYIENDETIQNILGGKLYKIEEKYFDILQSIIFIFASYGIFKVYKNNEIKDLLLPIIFLGGFTFHILWETKAIYVLQYYYLLLPYTSLGIYKLYEKIEGIKKKDEKDISNRTNVL